MDQQQQPDRKRPMPDGGMMASTAGYFPPQAHAAVPSSHHPEVGLAAPNMIMVDTRKRSRGPDEYGMGGDTCITRVQLNQMLFAKVIGKGGATIKQMRQQYGAFLKGVDINEEERMLVIQGTFVQVMDTFDAITDLIHSSHIHTNPAEVFSVTLMIENNRAGKLIGQKGNTFQSLKTNSHASHLHFNKDPVQVQEQPFRLLTISGALNAVRRAHYFILDLFYDFAMILDRAGGVHGLGPIHGMTLAEMLGGAPSVAPGATASPMLMGGGFRAGAGGGFGGSGALKAFQPPEDVIPFAHLNGRTGLHTDVVSQLVEMQAYINQFGLELQVVDKRHPPAHTQMPPMTTPGGMVGQAPQKVAAPDELSFLIPKDQAGAVIGVGGQGLREIREATGCKIFLSREENNGMRTVTIQHESAETRQQVQEMVRQRAETSVKPT